MEIAAVFGKNGLEKAAAMHSTYYAHGVLDSS